MPASFALVRASAVAEDARDRDGIHRACAARDTVQPLVTPAQAPARVNPTIVNAIGRPAVL